MSYLDSSNERIEEARRERALELALQGHESDSHSDQIVKRAEVFEAYLGALGGE